MIRISMNELTTYRWDFEDDVLRYADMGFEAIGVWRQKLTDYGALRGIELLHEVGLTVSNLLWAGGFTGGDGIRFAEAIDDAVEAIELAATLGSDCLVIYSGSRAGHTRNHAKRVTRQALCELLPVAEAYGVSLAMEAVHAGAGGEWTYLHDLQAIDEFLQSIPSSALKIVFDTYHLGLAPLNLRRIEELASRVAIVHLADGRLPTKGEPNRCLLGEGKVPLSEIAAALIQGGYRGYWDVELLGEDMEGHRYSDVLRHSRHYVQRLQRDFLNV